MLIDSIKGTQCTPIVVQALSHFVHTQEMQDSSIKLHIHQMVYENIFPYTYSVYHLLNFLIPRSMLKNESL